MISKLPDNTIILKENYCNTCPSKIRGLCCYHKKNFIINTNEVIYSNPCQYLNKAGRCKIYKKRFEINPNCMGIEKAVRFIALPEGCKYYEVNK